MQDFDSKAWYAEKLRQGWIPTVTFGPVANIATRRTFDHETAIRGMKLRMARPRTYQSDVLGAVTIPEDDPR